jgi:hypothetical protein
MKRIIIICEGPTEREFCNDVLKPYFNPQNIQIQSPLIKKSGGGIVSWPVLKKQIESHLKSDAVAFVTTLIDYYGILKKNEYPSWAQAHLNPNKAKRMDILEQGMFDEIAEELRYRFIPYIQLHEFEGLLFTDSKVFEKNFLPQEFTDKPKFMEIFNRYSNPEDINNGPITAPSKRLQKHIVGYDKIVYGATLAQETGLQPIRNKCPRFNNWISKLETL